LRFDCATNANTNLLPDPFESWHYPSGLPPALPPAKSYTILLDFAQGPSEQEKGKCREEVLADSQLGYLEWKRESRRLGENWLHNFTNHCVYDSCPYFSSYDLVNLSQMFGHRQFKGIRSNWPE